MARPDLAAQVRQLDTTRISAIDYIDPSSKDVEMFQAEVRQFSSNSGNKYDLHASDKRFYYEFLELALSMLSTVEQLNLDVPLRADYRMEGFLSSSIVLKSVKYMSLIPWHPIDLDHFGGFLKTMPCLERLNIERCGAISQRLPLNGLRCLVITTGSFKAKSLETVISCCPSLEHFELEDGDWKFDGGDVPWRRAQRIIHSRRETLKHLSLKIDTFDRDIPESDELFESFRDFDGLETLWLRITGFGLTVNNEVTTNTFPTDVEHVVSMLPGSLIRLGFFGILTGWDGKRILAQAIRDGHFPRLQIVMVEQGSKGLKEWEKILAEVGVACKYAGRTIDDAPMCGRCLFRD
ncbi:hypothetical protein V8C35DRAFT_326932 [Trichoderma chlorosporum]